MKEVIQGEGYSNHRTCLHMDLYGPDCNDDAADGFRCFGKSDFQ